MKVKEMIKELKLTDDATVFLHHYGKADDETEIEVKDIDSKVLNKQIVLVRAHYGGKEHGYGAYNIIYR